MWESWPNRQALSTSEYHLSPPLRLLVCSSKTLLVVSPHVCRESLLFRLGLLQNLASPGELLSQKGCL